MKKQGFRIVNGAGQGFDRWDNGKSFILPKNDINTLPPCLRQTYVTQNVIGFEVAKNYCKLKRGFVFTELHPDLYPSFWNRFLNKAML